MPNTARRSDVTHRRRRVGPALRALARGPRNHPAPAPSLSHVAPTASQPSCGGAALRSRRADRLATIPCCPVPCRSTHPGARHADPGFTTHATALHAQSPNITQTSNTTTPHSSSPPTSHLTPLTPHLSPLTASLRFTLRLAPHPRRLPGTPIPTPTPKTRVTQATQDCLRPLTDCDTAHKPLYYAPRKSDKYQHRETNSDFGVSVKTESDAACGVCRWWHLGSVRNEHSSWLYHERLDL